MKLLINVIFCRTYSAPEGSPYNFRGCSCSSLMKRLFPQTRLFAADNIIVTGHSNLGDTRWSMMSTIELKFTVLPY